MIVRSLCGVVRELMKEEKKKRRRERGGNIININHGERGKKEKMGKGPHRETQRDYAMGLLKKLLLRCCKKKSF